MNKRNASDIEKKMLKDVFYLIEKIIKKKSDISKPDERPQKDEGPCI